MGSAWSSFIDRTQCVQKAQLERWTILALAVAAARAQQYADRAAAHDYSMLVRPDDAASEAIASGGRRGPASSRSTHDVTDTASSGADAGTARPRGRLRALTLTRIQFHDVFVDFSYILPVLLAAAPKAVVQTHALEVDGPPSARRDEEAPQTAGPSSKEVEEAAAAIAAFKGLKDDLFDIFLATSSVPPPPQLYGSRTQEQAAAAGVDGAAVTAAAATRIRAADVFVSLALMCKGSLLQRGAFLYSFFADSVEWSGDVHQPRWVAGVDVITTCESLQHVITLQQVHDMLFTVQVAMKRVGVCVADIPMHVKDAAAALASVPRQPCVPGMNIIPPSAIAASGGGGDAAAVRSPSRERGHGAAAALMSHSSSMTGLDASLRRALPGTRATDPPSSRSIDTPAAPRLNITRLQRLRTLWSDGMDDDSVGVSSVVLVKHITDAEAAAVNSIPGIILPGRAKARFALLAKAAAAQDAFSTARDSGSKAFARVAELAFNKSSAASVGTAFASSSREETDGEAAPPPVASGAARALTDSGARVAPNSEEERHSRSNAASSVHNSASNRVPHPAAPLAPLVLPASSPTASTAASRSASVSTLVSPAARAGGPRLTATLAQRAHRASTGSLPAGAPAPASPPADVLLPGALAAADARPSDVEWMLGFVATVLQAPERWHRLPAQRRKALASLPGGRAQKSSMIMWDYFQFADGHSTQLAAEISAELAEARRVVAEAEADLLAANSLPETNQYQPAGSVAFAMAVLRARLVLKPPEQPIDGSPTSAAQPSAVRRRNSVTGGVQRRNSLTGAKDGGGASSDSRWRGALEMLRKYDSLLASPIPFQLLLDWIVSHPTLRFCIRQLGYPIGRVATYNGLDAEAPSADSRNKTTRDRATAGMDELERIRQLGKLMGMMGLDVQDLCRLRVVFMTGAPAASTGTADVHISYERFRRVVTNFMQELVATRREQAMLANYRRARGDGDDISSRLPVALPRPPPYASMTDLQRKKMLQSLFNLFDATGDDQVDLGEFSLTLARLMSGSAADKLTLMFDIFDADADGEVGPDELESIIVAAQGMSSQAAALENTKIADDLERKHDEMEFARELAEALDMNGDGAITKSEFFEILRREPLLYECFASALNMPLGTFDAPLSANEHPKSGPVFDFVMLHTIRNDYSIDLTRNRSGGTPLGRSGRRGSVGGRRGSNAAKATAARTAGADHDAGAFFAIDADDAAAAGGVGGERTGSKADKRKQSILDRAVDRHHFRRLLRDVWKCPEDALFLADRVFDYMDEDGSGSIDVRELYVGITTALRGPLETRADFFYRLFDVEGEGHMKSDEVLRMLLASSGRNNVSDDDARRVLARIDSDGSGTVERDEFLEAIRDDPGLLDALSRVFGTVRASTASKLFTASAESVEADDEGEGESLDVHASAAAPAGVEAGSASKAADLESPGQTTATGLGATGAAAPMWQGAVSMGATAKAPVNMRRRSITVAVESGPVPALSPKPPAAMKLALSNLPGTTTNPLTGRMVPPIQQIEVHARPRAAGAVAYLPAAPAASPTSAYTPRTMQLRALDAMVVKATAIDRRVEEHIESLSREHEAAERTPRDMVNLQEALEIARALAARDTVPAPAPTQGGGKLAPHRPDGDNHARPAGRPTRRLIQRVGDGSGAGSARDRSPSPRRRSSADASHSRFFEHGGRRRRKEFVYDDATGPERWYKHDPEVSAMVEIAKAHAEKLPVVRDAVRQSRRIAYEAERLLMSRVAEMTVRQRARHVEELRVAAAGRAAEAAALLARNKRASIAPTTDIEGDVAAAGAFGVAEHVWEPLQAHTDAGVDTTAAAAVAMNVAPLPPSAVAPVPTPLTVVLLSDQLPSPRLRSPRTAVINKGVDRSGSPRWQSPAAYAPAASAPAVSAVTSFSRAQELPVPAALALHQTVQTRAMLRRKRSSSGERLRDAGRHVLQAPA